MVIYQTYRYIPWEGEADVLYWATKDLAEEYARLENQGIEDIESHLEVAAVDVATSLPATHQLSE